MSGELGDAGEDVGGEEAGAGGEGLLDFVDGPPASFFHDGDLFGGEAGEDGCAGFAAGGEEEVGVVAELALVLELIALGVDGAGYGRSEAELFVELAGCGLEGGLVGFDLAAGGEPEGEGAVAAGDDEVDEEDAVGGVEDVDAGCAARGHGVLYLWHQVL